MSMSRAQDRAFEAADVKAEKAADEFCALLDSLIARLGEHVSAQYVVKKMITTLTATRPELFGLLNAAARHPPISLTGRDDYIMMKALAYAIEAIGRLPERWQEASDQKDMIELLNSTSNAPDFYRVGARGHLCQRGTTLKDGRLVVRDPEPGIVVSMNGAPL
jgi:hypothetical protein